MDERMKANRAAEIPTPSETDVVQAIVEIEKATQQASAQSDVLASPPADQPSWLSNKVLAVIFLGMALATVLAIWGIQGVVKKFILSPQSGSNGSGAATVQPPADPVKQAEAEGLLARVARGDTAAADQVLNQADSWTGKTQTTPRTDQLITTSLNLSDLHARAAALQAQLALNGIPRDAKGFTMLEQDAGDPGQRPFALWMLGALGNRGVDPVHAAKILDAYLNDPDVNVRSNAVIGLALLGTQETIPMLLDRFRNDPSPTVQELAGCGISQSGMYTHQQRMVVAASMVGWLDDSLLSQQQRTWVAQALHDISGQNFGADSAAWRRWYGSSR
jgi:HEAT repeats